MVSCGEEGSSIVGSFSITFSWWIAERGLWGILLALFSGLWCTVESQSAIDLIARASEDLERARRQEAGLLAPKNFARAEKEYAKYAELIREGKSERKIQAVVGRFQEAINATMDHVMQGNTILGSLLELRSEAISSNAPSMAPEEYRDGENRFGKAVGKLEQDRLAEAESLADEARVFYRGAIITATKVGLIGPAQATLVQVRTLDGYDLVPRTYQNAQSLISEVSSALDRGESLTPDLVDKAKMADVEARHALHLVQRIDSLRSDKSNWESLILEGEEYLRGTAEMAGGTYRFGEEASSVITETKRYFDGRIESLTTAVAVRDASILLLDSRIDSLEVAINQQQIRLASTLEQYQTDLQTRKEDLERRRRALNTDLRKQTILDAANQAQTRFDRKEVVVLRENNVIKLQIVGLVFDSGRTKVPKRAYPILEKLAEYLSLYPDGNITIEGHTDATGKEEKNLAYSESRAQSVHDYLIQTGGLREGRIEFLGFGSSKPVASNKTRSGRAQNRRIVVMITFAEEATGSR